MKNQPESVQGSGLSARAVTKYVRIAPRKVRLVINAIRSKPTAQAFPILMALKQKAARLTEKTLKSVVANARVLGMDETKLVISDIRADGGPVMKRFMSRSMGRADRILKRTTHLSIEVKEGQKSWPAASAPRQGEQREDKPHAAAGKGAAKKQAAAR